MRRSILNWAKVDYLFRMTNRLQEKLMKFATRGFQQTGFNDDQQCIIEMMHLRKELDDLIKESQELNKSPTPDDIRPGD